MRIDNSNYAVRAYFGIPLDAEPGTVAPIDLCFTCAIELDNVLGKDFYLIDRPPYPYDEYVCHVCGWSLDEEQDGIDDAYLQGKWDREANNG